MHANLNNASKLSIRQSIDSFLFIRRSGLESLDVEIGRLSINNVNTVEKERDLFISSTSRCIIVPNDFYSEDTQVDLIQCQMDYDSNFDTIHAVNIDEIKSKALFLIAQKDIEGLPKLTTTHDVKFLIQYVDKYIELKMHKASGLLINVLDGKVQIVAFKKGVFQLFNTFEFSSKTDFLYFVLLVFKQIGLDKLSPDILLAGEIVESSKIHLSLKDYFENIQFVSPLLSFDAEGADFSSRDLILWESIDVPLHK